MLQDLEEKLNAELTEALSRCIQDVGSFIQPLERNSEGIVAQIEDLQDRQSLLMDELSGIQQQAANIE